MFKPEDIVFYKKDENKLYTIVATPENTLSKETGTWNPVYIYSGLDKNSNEEKFFIRDKEDFENNFLKK